MGKKIKPSEKISLLSTHETVSRKGYILDQEKRREVADKFNQK